MNLMPLIKDSQGYWKPKWEEDRELFRHITSGLGGITDSAVGRFTPVARAHGTLLAPVADEESKS